MIKFLNNSSILKKIYLQFELKNNILDILNFFIKL